VIKVFLQPVDFATANTISRDTRSLEDQVNNFLMTNPQVLPQDIRLQQLTNGGDNYLVIALDYNLKNN
jgi:hypothetical protein